MKKFRSSHPIFSFRLEDAPFEVLPEPLWSVPRAPQEIHVQGNENALVLFQELPERGLSIVGSRECQPRSLRSVRDALSELRDFRLVILSGLARGIDASAHHWAMANGLPTIAILGCGMDYSYPEENHDLRHQILENGGLVISEFSRDEPPRRPNFVQRNRLIAGWAQATWVVEAGIRSGAINTSSWTKQQERFCFVTPCYPGDATLEGNQRILETHHVNEGVVRPFWSARSLGEVWLELESHLAARAPSAQKPLSVSTL